MKIPELREKLSGLSEKELVYLAVEFYKLIPKAKREMYQLDAMTETPDPASKPPKLQGSPDSIADMEHKIIEFIKHAESGYYTRYNTVVSRKARKAWRSTLKSWYKALTSTNRPEADLNKQAELLISLYLLLHRGTRTKTFTSTEPFEAINVVQSKYYRSVLDLLEHASGKSEVINRGIPLMLNSSDGKMQVTYLIDEFLLMISIPDLYEQAIEKIQSLLAGLNEENSKASSLSKMRSDYQNNFNNKVNTLAELGLKVYLRLGEHTNALNFFNRHYIQTNTELKLYMLIYYLFREGKAELIRQTIEVAKKNNIKPRKSLLDLDQYIAMNNTLPDSF
jgi:tetratricopeptide (TPR) repeat protein